MRLSTLAMMVSIVGISAWSQRASAACQTDTECKGGKACVKGECVARASCQKDIDCPGEAVCTGGKCFAAAPTPPPAESAPLPPPPAPPPVAAPPPPPPPPPAPAAPPASKTPTHAGEMGIQVSLPAGGDPTLGLTYFIADTMALRADVGIALTSQSGAGQSGSFEIALRDYITEFEHFMPFIQPGLWFGNPGSAFTFAAEGGVGGEYFVTDHFSFGALTGIALQIQAPPNSSAIVRFTTGTSAVFGQFLW